MPRFLFQLQQGKLPDPFALEDVLCDNDAARKAALGICADLAKDIVRGLTGDSEWQLNVLNEHARPVFRIRLPVESLAPATESVARV